MEKPERKAAKEFPLEISFNNGQLIQSMLSIYPQTETGENEAIPGFEELWYDCEVSFVTSGNSGKGLYVAHKDYRPKVSFALPGKMNGALLQLTLGHFIEGLSVTLQDNFNITILDVRQL